MQVRRVVIGAAAMLVCASSAAALGGLTASARYDAGTSQLAAPTSSSGLMGYAADAYTTSVNVAGVVKSSPTATSGLGCTSTAGIQDSNTLATVNVPNVITTGVLNTTASTTAQPASSASADVLNVNILNGLIVAQEIKSVSTTTHDSTGFHTSAAGSEFLDLTIGGVPMSATPAPNTTITLPLVGRVVLNEQKSDIHQKHASLVVNAIHVYATSLNTDIVVSHARSALQPGSVAYVDGHAYATSADVLGGVLISGETARVGIPCEGTNGHLHTNSLVGINVPGVLASGTLTSTAQASVDQTTAAASSATTSTIQALNVLNGLITADVISAHASAQSASGVTTFSDTGSTLLNLSIGGNAISADTPANTKLTLGPLTIWIHRVLKNASHIEVRMLEVVVNSATNPYGLSLGTDIRVAVAEASIDH